MFFFISLILLHHLADVLCRWGFMKERFGTVCVRRLLVNGKVGGLSMEQRQKLRKFTDDMLGKRYARADSICAL